MKIIILILAVALCAFVSANSSGLCRTAEVRVYSSLQKQAQVFNLDVKKVRKITMAVNEKEFRAQNYIPIEQAGLMLEKTPSSMTLDPIHHKYLRNEDKFVWLPYAYAGEWSRNAYTITTQMKRTAESKTEYPLVSFEFVNDPDIDSISGKDMDDLLANIKSNTQNRITTKSIVKSNINKFQDQLLANTNALNKMSKDNQSNQDQIAELKKTLALTISEIEALNAKEKTLQLEISVKSASLQTVNEQISVLNVNLALLVAQLKEEQAQLNAFKPADLTQLQNSLKLHLAGVQFPQTAPGRFLEEYSLCVAKKAKIVQDNYSNCNMNEANLTACGTVVRQGSQIKKKLRRKFF
jgi:hypothetical protein